jgi:hypothetical protein
MQRWLWLLGLLLTLLVGLGARPVLAVSNPVIQGTVSGTELCPQSACKAATFEGSFNGEPGNGYWLVRVTHKGLPPAGSCTDITGGSWNLAAGWHYFSGAVQKGTLCNTSKTAGAYDYFSVNAPLQLKEGGTGRIYVSGTLDHTPLYKSPPQPPTFTGTITQNKA